MPRYWVSWWGDGYNEETSFQWWDTGERFTTDGPNTSYVAVIDARDEASVWELIGRYFFDIERRFISQRADDWTPGDRFQ